MHEYVGNVHLHTTHSDGTAPHLEVVRIAAEAGLDFVIPTDHDTYVPALDGWYDDTLLLVGEEIRVRPQGPPGNHLLVFNVQEELKGLAPEPQRLVDEIRGRGGFCFIAHPFETAAPRFGERALPWHEWHLEGVAGISLWNYMSEFKTYLPNLAQALVAAILPRLFVRGPFPETVAKWDEMLAGIPAPIIGTSDAHATLYTMGPLRREVFSYDYLFRCVNLHILAERPFNRELAHDRRIVYEAMRRGNSFVGYDLLGDTRGFFFQAESGDERCGIGNPLELDASAKLTIRSPRLANLRLIHKGRIVARRLGRHLDYVATERGAYRVEALRWCAGRSRGWVYTNPIYLV